MSDVVSFPIPDPDPSAYVGKFGGIYQNLNENLTHACANNASARVYRVLSDEASYIGHVERRMMNGMEDE